jgi:hypothetical protein
MRKTYSNPDPHGLRMNVRKGLVKWVTSVFFNRRMLLLNIWCYRIFKLCLKSTCRKFWDYNNNLVYQNNLSLSLTLPGMFPINCWSVLGSLNLTTNNSVYLNSAHGGPDQSTGFTGDMTNQLGSRKIRTISWAHGGPDQPTGNAYSL